MNDQPDWNALAQPTESYSAEQAARELKQAALEDTGVELLRQFERLRARVRRMHRGE